MKNRFTFNALFLLLLTTAAHSQPYQPTPENLKARNLVSGR